MNLQEFFKEHNKIALALSGGVDSAFLLSEAIRCGARVKGYFVCSQFQPKFELNDVERLIRELNADVQVLEVDALCDEKVIINDASRCYYCKQHIMGAILDAAKADGFTELMEGTNASDDVSDRPGFKALGEMGIYSPLKLCGITKDEVRSLSRERGLFTCDKPSYACLATRIATGDELTARKLEITEEAEVFMADMGFRNFRVRMDSDGAAKIQLPKNQWESYMENEDVIVFRLSKLYSRVYLDRSVERQEL